jgi:hypothetical protein
MFNDKLALLKIIIVMAMAAIWLARAIYQAYVKPVSKAEGDGSRAGEPARPLERNLREFLAEIREQAANKAAGPRPHAPSPPPAQAPARELRAPPPRPVVKAPQPRPEREPAPSAREAVAQPPPLEAEEIPAAAPVSVHDYLEGLGQSEVAGRAKPPKKKERSKRRRPAEAGAFPSSSALSLSSSSVSVSRGPLSSSRDSPPLLIPGLRLSLRDAVLSQVILGPPRCRERRFRRR